MVGSLAKKSTKLSLLGFTFGLTAMVLLWVGLTQCNFIKFTSTGGTSDPITTEFGIYYYQGISALLSDEGTIWFTSCHTYPEYMKIDGAWRAARAFVVLTFLFSLVVITCNFLAICYDFSEISQDLKKEAVIYTLIGIFQGLTLLFLTSNACKNNLILNNEFKGMDLTFSDTCSMSSGAKCSISATVFWFAAAFSSLLGHMVYTKENAVVSPADSPLTEPLVGSPETDDKPSETSILLEDAL